VGCPANEFLPPDAVCSVDPAGICINDICTFGGRITIAKMADPNDGTDFLFSCTDSSQAACNEIGDSAGMFTLDDEPVDTDGVPDTETFTEVVAGLYSLQEVLPTGWEATDIICENDADGGTVVDLVMAEALIDLDPGEDITCTFFNFGRSIVKITKMTIPLGGTGFSFTSTGFGGLSECDITDAFMLDDMQTVTCFTTPGDYTITEDVPEDQALTIICPSLPTGSTVNSLMGELSFTLAQIGDNVDCMFINTFADTVVRVTDEPAGVNCEFGGTKLETGLDTNQNGVLDDDEIDDTEFVCNREPEPDGPQEPGEPDGPGGEDGDDGLNMLTDINIIPAGDICPDGGLETKTGLDLNGNGVLDENEVTDTQIVCNGAEGEDGSTTKCSIAGSTDNTDGVIGLAAMMIIPVMFVFTRRFRRRYI